MCVCVCVFVCVCVCVKLAIAVAIYIVKGQLLYGYQFTSYHSSTMVFIVPIAIVMSLMTHYINDSISCILLCKPPL